ncbi:hypothetical protein KORDIASMS9_02693 [Kordia sp. SMS9]|uniref:hypothetical protein n=1 Tax=Kordia sp. SMS9 TaxID=2282170 RepID=UPI000E0E0382|nr:hypothetical protein [Kordia sp. SMS9]AXG70453.1 hypothetical protein KORDIASMS9_02693 [Kordia sp. SMS9]
MKSVLIERSSQRSNVIPKVSINDKGSFFFNHKALELMGIKESAKLQIFQDSENKNVWYIHFDNDGYGNLLIKDSKKTNPSGQLSMTDVANKIRSQFDQDPKCILRFEIQEAKIYEEQEYFPLHVIKDSLSKIKVFGRPSN